jgi:hypothetical protein
MGEAVGGLVSCVLLSSESEEGEEHGEEDVARKTTIQLQRIATRCHCQIFYITYGEQPELEDGVRASPPPALLTVSHIMYTNELFTLIGCMVSHFTYISRKKDISFSPNYTN